MTVLNAVRLVCFCSFAKQKPSLVQDHLQHVALAQNHSCVLASRDVWCRHANHHAYLSVGPSITQQGAARRAGLAAGAAVWGVRGGGARHAAGPGARARAHLAGEQLHAGTPPIYPNPICSSPVPNIQRLQCLSWAWCPRWCAPGVRAAACRRTARIGKTLHQNDLILSHSGCVKWGCDVAHAWAG